MEIAQAVSVFTELWTNEKLRSESIWRLKCDMHAGKLAANCKCGTFCGEIN